jgi:hypothetical protein
MKESTKASHQIKNIFQDIRKAGKIQLEMVEVIKAEVTCHCRSGKDSSYLLPFEEMQANKESL